MTATDCPPRVILLIYSELCVFAIGTVPLLDPLMSARLWRDRLEGPRTFLPTNGKLMAWHAGYATKSVKNRESGSIGDDLIPPRTK